MCAAGGVYVLELRRILVMAAYKHDTRRPAALALVGCCPARVWSGNYLLA
jgi:hypothetical protein